MKAADVLLEAPSGYEPIARLKIFVRPESVEHEGREVLAQLWTSWIIDRPDVWVAIPREEVQ